ncbi:hypothetical protein ACSZMF_14270 [Aeromonas caviae]|uniref:hypothetical protein n=1 Tax=Aeromonas caviae TaxID=648 RepID=UPI003EC5F472
MTFLELCQRLRAECQDLGSGPETVSGQTGRNLRYIEAIRESWIKLQTSRADWDWLTSDTPTPLQVLADDSDTPFIDEAYHVVIVWNALRKMSISELAEELILRGEDEFATWHTILCKKYISQSLSFGGWGNL